MSSPMLQAVWPEAMAARGEELSESVALGSASRLAEFVRDSLGLSAEAEPERWDEWPLKADLVFTVVKTEGSLAVPAVRGKARVCLPVACERCLGLMRRELEVDIAFLLPTADIPEDTLPGYDVWVVGDRGLRPLDLVEEELLLSLPLALKHEDRRDCDEGSSVAGGPPAEEDAPARTPFSGLRELLDRYGDKEH